MSISTTPTPAPAGPPRFTDFLAQVEDGRLATKASEELATLVKELKSRVENAGPKHKAKLTVTVTFDADGSLITVGGDVDVKIPKLRRQKSIMYFVGPNGLSVNNPRQQDLFDGRSAAAGERSEPRDVGDSAPGVRVVK